MYSIVTCIYWEPDDPIKTLTHAIEDTPEFRTRGLLPENLSLTATYRSVAQFGIMKVTMRFGLPAEASESVPPWQKLTALPYTIYESVTPPKYSIRVDIIASFRKRCGSEGST
jgi:hypothetical protein